MAGRQESVFKVWVFRSPQAFTIIDVRAPNRKEAVIRAWRMHPRAYNIDAERPARDAGRGAGRVATSRDLTGGKRTRAYEAELHAKALAQEADARGRGAGATARAFDQAARLWREAKSYERAEKLEKEAERWIAWGKKHGRI